MRYLITTSVAFVCACCYGVSAFADSNCGDGFTTVQFVRDDLAGLKKEVETAIAAIPKPHAPYAKAEDHWDLPAYTCKDKTGLQPVDVSYTSTYNTDASMQKLEMGYQKQMMAAQAKGDYQAMMKISQEMQSKAMAQASANEGMPPLNINITVNGGNSGTIDPDTVIRDGQGFIAIRTNKDQTSGNENISIYFDPVALKNAHQLAQFDLSGDYRVDSKLSLLSLRVDLSGPSNILEPMVKQVDVSKVLGTLTTSRKKLASDN